MYWREKRRPPLDYRAIVNLVGVVLAAAALITLMGYATWLLGK